MPNKFDDTFREYHKKIVGGTKLLSGLLGIYLGGTQRISVPNRPNYVYVRLRDSQSEVIQAYNETVSLIFGLPIVLFWEGNRYVIKGKDTGRYGSYWGYDESYYLPAHGGQHSLSLDVGGGGDPTFIYGRQFMPLGVFPSGTSAGGVVLGDNYVFRKPDNSWMVFGVTGTPNFTIYNPTGSSAIMLLMYGDTDTGNIGFIVNSGSPFDNSITGAYGIVPYLPEYSDDTWLPMFGIRLTSGTKTVSYASMYDVRQYYTPQATGSAGQDLSGYITGSWGLLNGAFAPTGTAGSGDITGSWDLLYGTFAPTGTAGGGDVTGSWDLLYGTFAASGTAGGQTTWIGFYDDDVFVASGTHISYGDNLNVVVTGSTAYVSADVITGAFITGSTGGGTVNPSVCEGRLTLESGVAVSTSDQSAKTTVYFTPYKGNLIAIYDGVSAWEYIEFTEVSSSLGGLTSGTNYDVFGYDSGGSTLALQLVAWSNDTTRATALTTQDGVYVKSGDIGKRYLGTIRINNAGGQCEDTVTKRFVWNYYNRTKKRLVKVEATNNWTYTTAVWRSANNSTANRVEVVIGLNEEVIKIDVDCWCYTLGTTANAAAVGIALDATNTSHAQIMSPANGNGVVSRTSATYIGYSGIGYHYFQWTEYPNVSGGTPNCLYYGDNGTPSFTQSGMTGFLMG